MLIALLGISSDEQEEYAVALLAILTDRVDESKCAITASGGIPPLVQLMEIGSLKAKEDPVQVLLSLCCHSNNIRACVWSCTSCLVAIEVWHKKAEKFHSSHSTS